MDKIGRILKDVNYLMEKSGYIHNDAENTNKNNINILYKIKEIEETVNQHTTFINMLYINGLHLVPEFEEIVISHEDSFFIINSFDDDNNEYRVLAINIKDIKYIQIVDKFLENNILEIDLKITIT